MKKNKSKKNKDSSFYKNLKAVSNGKWDYLLKVVDFAYSKLRFHITDYEYLKYNFYNYKDRYRKNFLLLHHKKNYRYISARSFTVSKYIFYKRIPDLYQRGITLFPYCGIDEFLSFARKYRNILAKPDRGTLGGGIELFVYTNDDSAREFYGKLSKDTPMILEEYISQHEKLNELNPFCVNTVRIVSILYDGEVEIVSASLKTGGLNINYVDNIRRGGLSAQVDIETGIVTTPGKDSHNKTYFYHPVTGAQIVGFSIPNWDAAIELVKKAHARLPQCHIYGWDIAITPAGADIVEANNAPDTKLMQVMDLIPKGEKIIKLTKTVKLDQDYSKTYKFIPDYESYFTAKETDAKDNTIA